MITRICKAATTEVTGLLPRVVPRLNGKLAPALLATESPCQPRARVCFGLAQRSPKFHFWRKNLCA